MPNSQSGEHATRTESTDLLLISPLHNFDCEKRLVKLDDHNCIRHIRNNEIENLLSKTPVPQYYEALKHELSSIEFVLEERQKARKGLPYKLETGSVGQCLLALRLFKKADVEVPCSVLLEKEEDFVANLGVSLGETSYSANPYCLEKKEIPDFVRLWNKLKRRDAKPNLHFSFHEFSQAFETHIIEYKIYHYVVALESLVFYNIDRTFPHKGSLIGLSIGMLLGTNQKERDSIREMVEKAYQIRNGVAHGIIKYLEKHDKESEEIATKLEDYLRKTLKRLLLEEEQ